MKHIYLNSIVAVIFETDVNASTVGYISKKRRKLFFVDILKATGS